MSDRTENLSRCDFLLFIFCVIHRDVSDTEKPQEIKYVKNCSITRHKRRKKKNWIMRLKFQVFGDCFKLELWAIFWQSRESKINNRRCTTAVTLFSDMSRSKKNRQLWRNVEVLLCNLFFFVRVALQRKISARKLAKNL